MVGLISLGVFVLIGVAALWAKGIDEMHEKHPDYKGEDLFGEEEQKEEELQVLGSNVKPSSITFQNNGEVTPIIEFNANGDIYVKGNLIENDKELVDAMREFLNKAGL